MMNIISKLNFALTDRLRVLEEEFDVKLRVVSNLENNPVDVNVLASDPDVKHTLEASREDRRSGRVYSGEAALEMLRKINRETQDGANL